MMRIGFCSSAGFLAKLSPNLPKYGALFTGIQTKNQKPKTQNPKPNPYLCPAGRLIASFGWRKVRTP